MSEKPRLLQRLVRRCLGVLAKALDRDPFYGFACDWQWFRRAKGGTWERWILDYPVMDALWFEKATYPDKSRPNGGARGTPTVETWPQPNLSSEPRAGEVTHG
jgi:hypothetical protein